MKFTARPIVAAGAAVVGAALIAGTTLPADDISVHSSDVDLSAGVSYQQDSYAELLEMSGARVTGAIVGAPVVPAVIGAAMVGGDEQMLYNQLRHVIDTPLYLADPLLEAVARALPKGLGGGTDGTTEFDPQDGSLMGLRHWIWSQQEAFRTDVAGLLGATDVGTARNPAADVTRNLMNLAVNTGKVSVLAPVGLVKVAQAIAAGDDDEVYLAFRDYIDGPQWILDSAIEAVAAALPESLGGGSDGLPTASPADGDIVQFRNGPMLDARAKVRGSLADLLGVPVDSNGDLLAAGAESPQTERPSAAVVSRLREELAKVEGMVTDRAGKLVLNRDSSLNSRVNEVGSIAGDAARGDLRGAVTGARAAIRDRVTTAGKDIRRGLEKVKKAVDRATGKSDK